MALTSATCSDGLVFGNVFGWHGFSNVFGWHCFGEYVRMALFSGTLSDSIVFGNMCGWRRFIDFVWHGGVVSGA